MNSIQVASVVCPQCGAELDVRCERCPHCQSSLRVGVASPTADANDEPAKILDRPWVLTVLLLHVGFLGIPFYWKTSYSLQTRIAICLISIVYTLFVVAVVAIVGSWLYRVFTGG